jgi:hypothetical protein
VVFIVVIDNYVLLLVALDKVAVQRLFFRTLAVDVHVGYHDWSEQLNHGAVLGLLLFLPVFHE